MAKTVTVIPLNGSNYPTWKVQCRMALMKDGLWSIVSGSERPPDIAVADKYAKFAARGIVHWPLLFRRSNCRYFI